MANIVRRNENERGIARREPYQLRDPFRSLADLMRFPFDELERSIGVRPAFIPDVDLRETSDSYLLEVDLPGFRQEDIEITITGDRLTISGRREAKEEDRQYLLRERSAGEFVRAFGLPSGCDADGVKAEMKEGVLVVSIPKRPEVQARRITLGKSGTQASGGGGTAQAQPAQPPPRS